MEQDPSATPEVIARAWWSAFDDGNYGAAARLLAEGTVVDWPVSGERMNDAHAWQQIKEAYPAAAPWRCRIVDIVANGPDVVTFTQVFDGETFDFAISRFRIENGQITRLVEYWPERVPAPAWRLPWITPLTDPDNPMMPTREDA